MKPIFKTIALAKKALSATLSLKAEVTHANGKGVVSVVASSLQGLKVLLYKPNTSGAYNLIKSGECTLSENKIVIALSGFAQGTYFVKVALCDGTNTRVVYTLEIVVPATLADGTQSYADDVVAVSTYGDGPDVPITVDTEITESGTNPVTGAAIYAGLGGKQDAGTYADGNTYQKGEGTPATIVGKVIMGQYNVADTQDDYALIVGNGTDAEHLSNAFAIDKTGNLVLFNAGAAVVLTPAKLATLIA